MRRRLMIAGGLVPALTVAFLGHGCAKTSSITPGPADAGYVIGDAQAERPTQAEASEGGPTACESGPVPTTVPPGWVRWSGYDACCGFYVPASGTPMPQPIQWGPCEVSAQPAGLVCREIVSTWNLRAGELAPFGSYTASQVSPDGGVTLATARLVDDGAGDFVRYTLIADADGPVRQAVFESTTKQCASIIESVQDGVAVYHVYEGNNDFGGGAFGGSIDDPAPRTALKFADHVAHEFAAGLPGIVDDATMQLYDWLKPSQPPTRIMDPLDQPSAPSFLAFSGQALFWQAQTASLQKEKVWTPSGGARDFVAFASDPSQGAADLGTDGHDMVWLQGAGRSAPTGPFPSPTR